MPKRSITNSVAFALLLIAAMQVSAQSIVQTSLNGNSPFKFTVSLTATVEGGFYGGPPVFQWTRETTTTTHWTSQSLLNFAESALSKRFPTNSSLAQSYTNIVVVDATGTNVVENLTADGIATITISDTSVTSGKSNDSGAAIGSQSYIFRLSFDDGNGNSFNLTGLAREKYSYTAVDQFLETFVTETVSSTLIGEGFVVVGQPIFGSQPAVFTGSALSSGTDKPHSR